MNATMVVLDNTNPIDKDSADDDDDEEDFEHDQPADKAPSDTEDKD